MILDTAIFLLILCVCFGSPVWFTRATAVTVSAALMPAYAFRS